MKKLNVGILAHVDAGKTTLSESLLYISGAIRKPGRVDNKDAFLDTNAIEKARGITIFSKQAILAFDQMELTLLDTPGHVDFSAEMERTLQVLDYAILVVSGADGVQSHTRTLWELLKFYQVPTFIFVNKMDQPGTDPDWVMDKLQKELGGGCIAFDRGLTERDEQLALCDEAIMDHYLETGAIQASQIVDLVANRQAFPVYFGSALKQEGVEAFLEGFESYTKPLEYPRTFGAKVFKITRDDQGNRLTHLKITGGQLGVKDLVAQGDIEEKVNQIRLYSGEKFKAVPLAQAGQVCAVTGLTASKPGDGLGSEAESTPPRLEPVLAYRLVLPEDLDPPQILPKLRELEEEEPELQVTWNEVLQEINIQVMGAVQLEILETLILERFGHAISFDNGQVVYKETIENTVEGVGHFEPLRHYAEVHLLLEPGPRGSGLVFDADCREDILDRNYQRLVLTHLHEKAHKGVLIGAHVTDMKITLVTGRAHNKHTAGGDFREATFRALRQGLMKADTVLLEPYYRFRLILPEAMVGRAMTDVGNMKGTSHIESTDGAYAVLTGSAPVVTLRNYQQEVNAYTKGEGRLSLALDGYNRCHNSDHVIGQAAYDPDQDVLNPTGSVFCTKGTGFLVPWDQVDQHMHLEYVWKAPKVKKTHELEDPRNVSVEEAISLEEIDALINSSGGANQGKKGVWKKQRGAKESYYTSLTTSGPAGAGRLSSRKRGAEDYLLVDGYNIIHAWPELLDLSKDNMEAARKRLIDIMSNYQPLRKCQIMIVFDAYRVEGRKESVETHQNIQVVFTGEAQTADHFIEKFAHSNQTKFNITVATSDGLQQIIIRGAGAHLLSASDLLEQVTLAEDELHQDHLTSQGKPGASLEDALTEEVAETLRKKAKE